MNWDFPVRTPGSIDNLHWYPGTFPPDLPATLIEALTSPGDLVLDPFGGIGTTGWEALRLGRHAWLVDQNLVAAIASYVNTTLALVGGLDDKLIADFFDEIEEMFEKLSGRSDRLPLPRTAAKEVEAIVALYSSPEPQWFLDLINAPNWKALLPWVEKSTLKNIKQAMSVATDFELPPFMRLVLYTMISAVLRGASSQNSSWGHVADNVQPKEFKVKDFFLASIRWIRRTKKTITKAHYKPRDSRKPLHSWTSVHSWTKDEPPLIVPNAKARALITSPPYSCAIDYTMSQRLSFYLFGQDDRDLSSLVAQEIGARRKRFAEIARENWVNELVDAISKHLDFVSDDGYLALIMPHKEAGRDRGIVSTSEYLLSVGWKSVFETDRSIRQVRTRQSWTSIKRETIFVFSKN